MQKVRGYLNIVIKIWTEIRRFLWGDSKCTQISCNLWKNNRCKKGAKVPLTWFKVHIVFSFSTIFKVKVSKFIFIRTTWSCETSWSWYGLSSIAIALVVKPTYTCNGAVKLPGSFILAIIAFIIIPSMPPFLLIAFGVATGPSPFNPQRGNIFLVLASCKGYKFSTNFIQFAYSIPNFLKMATNCSSISLNTVT